MTIIGVSSLGLEKVMSANLCMTQMVQHSQQRLPFHTCLRGGWHGQRSVTDNAKASGVL